MKQETSNDFSSGQRIFFELSNMEILAEHIMAFRERHSLSQEAFADRCNLHRTYIGSIERYERNVSLKTLEGIAKAIGVPLFQLFIPAALQPMPAVAPVDNGVDGHKRAMVPPPPHSNGVKRRA